jgi:hypothetical protein
MCSADDQIWGYDVVCLVSKQSACRYTLLDGVSRRGGNETRHDFFDITGQAIIQARVNVIKMVS